MAEAVLYVEIVPTTKGIKGKVEGEFSAGFKGVESQASGVFGRIAGFAKGAATAVAGAAAALAGLAIKGGLSRLLNIEDAQAKLKGLGHDAGSVTTIMGNALAAVKGTAFGLDEAATIAASAVAAGIKPGQELERYLRLTADAATIAGGSLDELGSVMNNVTTLGAAYNDSLQILAGKGIPIYQWLADELGVTTDAVKTLASEGKISSEVFQKAIENNIGGAALSAGDTTRGAFANMLASLSRVGANLLTGVFPLFKETFQGIIEFLGPIEEKAAALGVVIGEKVTPFLEGLRDAISGGLPDLSQLSTILGPLVGGFLALGVGGLGGIISKIPLLGGIGVPLSALAGPLGIILGLVSGLVATSPELQSALGGAFDAILTAVGGVVTQLQPVFSDLMPVITVLAQQLGTVLAGAVTILAPIIAQVVHLLGDLLAQALPLLIPLIGQLGGFVLALAGTLLPVASAVLQAVMPALQALIPIILSVISAVMPLVSSLLDALMPVILSLAPVLVNLAELISDGLVSILPDLIPIIAQVSEVFGALLTAVMPIVSQLISALMPAFEQLVPVVLSLLAPLLDLVMAVLVPLTDLIGPLINTALVPLMAVFQAILPFIMAVVTTLATSLIPVIEAVSKILGGLIDFLVGVFTGDWDKAWKGVQDIFSGIWDGIVAILKGALNIAIDLINGIIGAINGALGGISDATGGAIDLRIPPIPHLASGAWIDASPGGSPVVVGEGRYDEAVLPLGGPQLDRIREAINGGGGGEGDRPIYADGIGLLGWLRDVAGQQAQFIFNTQLSRGYAASLGR